jgi:hypothetical protein
MAAQAPQLYDQPELHRQVLTVFGLKDVQQIVKSPDDIKPMDPVSENMGILTLKPVRAFLWQDHESHIKAHMMAAQDPLIQQMVGQSPQAQQIMSGMISHVTEHLAMKYRQDLEKQMGVELPPIGETLPPDVEVQLSKLVADAAEKLFHRDQQLAQMLQTQAQGGDPLAAAQMADIKVKQQEVDRKKLADQRKHQIDSAKVNLEAEKIKSEERKHGAQIGADIGDKLIELHKHQTELQRQHHLEGAKLGVDIAKHHRDAKQQEQMQQREAMMQQQQMQHDHTLHQQKLQQGEQQMMHQQQAHEQQLEQGAAQAEQQAAAAEQKQEMAAQQPQQQSSGGAEKPKKESGDVG